MIDTVRIALGRPDRASRHYECRHCGTALPRADAECPSCETSDVAIFEL